MGVIILDSWTSFGTVSTIRWNKLPQVSRKRSGEVANFRIKFPPSELKMRKSERVVSLGPNAKGFWVLFSRNWTALRKVRHLPRARVPEVELGFVCGIL